MIDPRSDSERSEDALGRVADDATISNDAVKRIHDRVVNRFVDWYLTKARAKGANSRISSDAQRLPASASVKSRFNILRQLGAPVVAASIVGIAIVTWYQNGLASVREDLDVERTISAGKSERISELEQKLESLEVARSHDARAYANKSAALSLKCGIVEDELVRAKEEIDAKDRQVQDFSKRMKVLLAALEERPQHLDRTNAKAMDAARSHTQMLNGSGVSSNAAKSAGARGAAAAKDKK